MAQAKRSGRLERMVSVRLAPDEEELIREEAARRGVSVSNLMRLAALRECRPALKMDAGSFSANTPESRSVTTPPTTTGGSSGGLTRTVVVSRG